MAKVAVISEKGFNQIQTWINHDWSEEKKVSFRLNKICILKYFDTFWYILNYFDVFWYILKKLIYFEIFLYILIHFDTFWYILKYFDTFGYILKYFDIFWYILKYFDIFWYILKYFEMFWFILISFEIFKIFDFATTLGQQSRSTPHIFAIPLRRRIGFLASCNALNQMFCECISIFIYTFIHILAVLNYES